MKMRLKFRDVTLAVALFGALSAASFTGFAQAELALADSDLIDTVSAGPQTTEKPAAEATEPSQIITLNGSWTLVSGRYLDGEGKWIDYASLGLSAIKVISNGYFSFTTMKTVKNKTEFWAAGAGEYRLEGNEYTEYPSLNSFNVPKGQGFGFEIELIGNEWHTRRVEDGVLKEEEVWRRLD